MAAKRQILSRDTFGTLGHHISTARTHAEDVLQGVRDTTLCKYLYNCDFAQKLGVSKLKIPLPRLWSLTRRLHHIRRCRGCVPLSSDFEPTAPKDMLQHTGRITRKARVD